MSLEIEEIGDVIVIVPKDEITPLLSYRMETYIRSGVIKFVIDLDELPSIGSLEIGLLISALKRAREAEGNLILTGVKPLVKTTLEWASLTKILDIYETREEAVKSFAAKE